MKLRKLILFLTILIGTMPLLAENNYKVTASTRLNIRKSPSTSSTVLGTFESGQQIEVISINNGWATVKFKGKTGYVSDKYITAIFDSGISQNKNITSHINNNEVSQETYNESTIPISNDADIEISFEAERKSSTFEIGYDAGSFKHAKLSGSYGISMTFLPWEIAPNIYAGFHFSPAYANFGLAESGNSSVIFKLGPAVGYYFTPKIFVATPLDILCGIYTNSESKTKTTWGLSLAPTIYIGNKGGVFIGPQFGFAFAGDSEVGAGFRVGIYF